MNVCHDINATKAQHDRDAAAWLAQVERERAAASHKLAVGRVLARIGTPSKRQRRES